MQETIVPLTVYLMKFRAGKCSGISFLDSKAPSNRGCEGEIVSFCITAGNVDDRDFKTISTLTKEIYGKLFADKGYISKGLFEQLLEINI